LLFREDFDYFSLGFLRNRFLGSLGFRKRSASFVSISFTTRPRYVLVLCAVKANGVKHSKD
jgi:hypothetical protein